MLKNIQSLLMNAVIAAVYAVLTIGLSPVSYGPIQVRLSECMVLLAFYNRKWIPGLTIGCLLANLNSPFGVTDIVVGTTATLVSLLLMRFAPNVFTASLAPVLINGIFIGLELAWLSQIGTGDSLIGVMAYRVGRICLRLDNRGSSFPCTSEKSGAEEVHNGLMPG